MFAIASFLYNNKNDTNVQLISYFQKEDGKVSTDYSEGQHRKIESFKR